MRTFLLLDPNFFVLFMPMSYRFRNSGRPQEVLGYAGTRNQLSAIYASQRLKLPFEGVLLVGY